MVSLKVYQRKRKFSQTPEPRGKTAKRGSGPLRFVVQMHEATRLHFDLRLEFAGVFKSWAVPKGPSLNPLDQRLAIFVEDHPLEYGSFEGIIPKGNYGAGTVMIWDEGTYVERGSKGRADSETAMKKNFAKGHITFVLNGRKLNGEFALVRLKEEKTWLLLKKRDEHSSYKRSEIPHNLSVKTGRSIEEIAAEAEARGDVWLPAAKRKEKKKSASRPKKALPEKSARPHKSLSAQPMPRKIKPMIPIHSRQTPNGDDWLYEPAPQGLRAIAEVESKKVNLYSKSGISFSKKYPKIMDELRNLMQTAVFDGEIIANCYWVFDLLYYNGKDLRQLPLRDRKHLLGEILPSGKSVKMTLPATRGSLVAKNLDSPYNAGTSSEWLLLDSGSGLPREKKDARAPEARKNARAIEAGTRAPTAAPALEAQKQVTNKSTKPKSQLSTKKSPTILEPRLTNLEKIYFPDDGISKGDVINYYKSISKYILPYLKDRPQSLNRQPNGIAAKGFYQKDVTGHIPRWLKIERIFSESADKTIDYLVCQDERSLLYIANLGCIEINPWFSRTTNLDNPDFMVIDLDPDGNSFKHVVEIAHQFRELLDNIGVRSFCKTSGATGIHIGVPTGAKYDFDIVRMFAETACRIVAKKNPATTSLERNPQRRRGKIYLDFMQNRRGQTLAAPFCIRPHPGAPVSMPMDWKDLKLTTKPGDFNIHNAHKYISKADSVWRGVLGKAINLKRCLAALNKLK